MVATSTQGLVGGYISALIEHWVFRIGFLFLGFIIVEHGEAYEVKARLL